MSDIFDVAIVGYGPVGQALAILLGQRGRQVAVFEKQPAMYPLPRAVHFDHEVARILQACELGADLPRLSEPADIYEWRNATGETLLRIPSRAAGLCGWPEANMFAQPEIERLLDARARALPSVDVRRGCEAIDLHSRDDHVDVQFRQAHGEVGTVAARFVVGCDGANSFVRPHLGATVTDLGFFYDWLIVDVVPHQPKVWRPLNIQICDPARPTTLVSGGPGRRRWEFMRLPHESVDALNNEATAWTLLAPWGLTPDNTTLERHAVYRFQARWVDTWRRGRLLLAGDAAHQMPPFAGQGMCAGLRDAANLAWKLDLVLRGGAPEEILDTYARERVPHVRSIINFSMELGKVICVPDPAAAAARDAAKIEAAKQVSPEPPPPLQIGRGVTRTDDSHAGQLCVQGRVEHRGVTGLFDDVVGRGWTLLSTAGDPGSHLDGDGKEYFAALGGITAHIGSGAPIRDLDGAYARWFAQTGTTVVLQRPDFYLFGGAADLAASSELVAELRRALRAS